MSPPMAIAAAILLEPGQSLEPVDVIRVGTAARNAGVVDAAGNGELLPPVGV